VYVVVDRRRAETRERSLEIARWGLIPSWAKDPSIGARLVNARAETLAEKPAFRGAYAKRRCLVPADGYYEWYQPTDGVVGRSGKPLKQPFFIHRTDGHPLAMAGLYEWWKDPDIDPDDPAAWRLTCTVITTAATDAIGRIHDRMPMVIEARDWASWLDPEANGDPQRLLTPAGETGLDAYPVSTAVNNVRNNGPALIEAIEAEPDVLPGTGL
jgi:putative SOS response-associated peptidase YedK